MEPEKATNYSEHGTPRMLTVPELIEKCTRPGVITLVGMVSRLGMRRFMMELEYDHFTPATPKNEQFEFALMRWPFDKTEPQIDWALITVPEDNLALVDRLLDENDLHRVQAGAMPLILGGSKEQFFPISGPNVFAVESNPGAAIYGPNREAYFKKENEWIEARINQHDEWLRSRGL